MKHACQNQRRLLVSNTLCHLCCIMFERFVSALTSKPSKQNGSMFSWRLLAKHTSMKDFICLLFVRKIWLTTPLIWLTTPHSSEVISINIQWPKCLFASCQINNWTLLSPEKMISSEALEGVPLLVLANKQDVPVLYDIKLRSCSG